eukprot:GHVS01049351.1.p1 GENE.GHVS01049351.1~~GHVS01049351.1.p1  ORF type:complete len:175 (+),score=6.67 GHVS01049351.1:356-880(+)
MCAYVYRLFSHMTATISRTTSVGYAVINQQRCIVAAAALPTGTSLCFSSCLRAIMCATCAQHVRNMCATCAFGHLRMNADVYGNRLSAPRFVAYVQCVLCAHVLCVHMCTYVLCACTHVCYVHVCACAHMCCNHSVYPTCTCTLSPLLCVHQPHLHMCVHAHTCAYMMRTHVRT